MTVTDRINGLNQGVAYKAPVRVATTANITLSGTQTIDGVAVVADDRVLVKDQTDDTENGIYIASASAWSRSKDFDSSRDVTEGTIVYVLYGTVSTRVYYSLTTTDDPIDFGTSSITFTRVNGFDEDVDENGLTYGDGTDQDIIIATMNVTGSPKFSWDESADSFRIDKSLILGTDGEVTHTIAGASVTSQLEVHSSGASDLGGLTIHRHTDSNDFGSHILGMRSRGTHDTETIVQDNDTLLRVIACGYDGTDEETAAEIRFLVDGTPGNNDMPGEIAFFTNAGSQTLTKRGAFRADGTFELGSGIGINSFLDEDNMASNSATALPTQQSVKAYVDAENSKLQADFLHIQDQKTTGTDGGTSAATTWNTRDLNTVVTNEISGASLSSNQITLPAGTYYIEASGPATRSQGTQLRLYNITDASTELLGQSAYSGSGDNTNVHSLMCGRFTIADAKVFEVDQYTITTVGTLGLGTASDSGSTEIYTDVKIWKVA